MGGFKTLSKLLLGAALVATVAGFTPVATQGEKAQPVYAMFVNGHEVGTVKFAGRGLSVYDKAVQALIDEYEEEIYIEGEVFFREKTAGKKWADSEEDLVDVIRQSLDIKIDAFAIVINEKTVCYVKTQEEAQAVLDTIQKPYIENINSEDNHQLEDIVLQEDISIKDQQVLYAHMVDVDRAVQIITVGEEGAREYTVKKGDSLWSIARAHDVRVVDIEAANPNLKGDTIGIGETLNIMTVKSLVTVVTKEKYTYKEAIPFPSETRDDNTIFVGETKVTQKGRNGEKEIQVYIHKENGRETGREKISETILVEPASQITAKGTKARPAPVVSRGTNVRLTRPSDLSPSARSGVQLTPWSSANSIFPRGSIAKVTHIDSNLVFYAYRHGGTLHADVEPLTAADTAIMRRIYGSFSWDREAVIVEINGKKMAGSMNGMPHGNYTITNNNYRGHFCIHFLNSRTHGTNRIDAEHQATLKRVPG